MRTYGDFSKDGKEFIISSPNTPRPWINYLCNRDGSYVSLLSANAGGYSYIKCPKDGRLTRWRYNSLPDDRPGKYIYLRNSQTKDYWSLSWQPTAKPLEHYNVRHGLGYTTFECDYANIKAKATYFVPLDGELEIWQVSLKNNSDSEQELEIYPYAEMCLGHALTDLINKPNDQHFNRLWFDKENNTLFSTKTYWLTGGSTNIQENKSWNQIAFMNTTLPVYEYAGEREVFVGNYRDEKNPQSIEKGKLQSKDVSSGNLVSSLKLKVNLKPGEEKKFNVLLGVVPKTDKLEKPSYIEKYESVKAAEQALEEVKKYWSAYCSSMQVKTPSKAMNTYLNTWNQYQGKITFINSRNASYYHWGVLRGMGFRDSLQDTISVVINEPELVRERILLLSSYQRPDGVCAHCFHPVSGEAEFTGHKDDPLWLINATWYYLAETGDSGILNESAPFHNGKSGTLLDHLKASISFIENNLGASGIPTFGKGDWNDTLDFVGGVDGMGESIWAGMFYAYNLRLFKEIVDKYTGDEKYSKTLSKQYSAVNNALNSYAWDGDWYIRAVCSDGTKLGSKECNEGQIYLNPQSWAILSGVAVESGVELMKTTLSKLDTDFGPKLLTPAYSEINKSVGLITRCVQGKKENGSIFNHTATWAIMALCELGMHEEAVKLYEKLIPSSFSQERYQIEPYVYAQYTTSDEHETFGQGSHSWLTGTAAWMFRTALDYILGIRVTLDGIILKTYLPDAWDSFKVVRKYRDTTYHITVKKSSSPKSISCNGKEIPMEQALPLTGGDLQIEVLI